MKVKKKIKIFCTIGPSSLNKKFLHYARGKVDLLRLNMSHLSEKKLVQNIKFILKNSKIPICIDTEGAQIRTKSRKKYFYKKNKKFKIYEDNLYPHNVLSQLRKNDHLQIGFRGLEIKIIQKKSNYVNCITINDGWWEPNKGVNIKNRKIKLNYLTKKDFAAIEIGKKFNINYFALSFTNSANDVKKFNSLLPLQNKIYKLETKLAIKNLKKILLSGKNFLIDRGDLSKEIEWFNIPKTQRLIIKAGNELKKNIFIATNFLESMVINKYPTQGEINDIYNAIEIGAKGIVLAGETAIGKNPIMCVETLNKITKT